MIGQQGRAYRGVEREDQPSPPRKVKCDIPGLNPILCISLGLVSDFLLGSKHYPKDSARKGLSTGIIANCMHCVPSPKPDLCMLHLSSHSSGRQGLLRVPILQRVKLRLRRVDTHP